MLKIKDDVKIEDLNKLGFKVEICKGKRANIWKKLSYISVNTNKESEDYLRIYISQTISRNNIYDLLYDMISQGLIEKI